MGTEVVQLTRRRFGQTMRRDAWWVQPLVVFVILTAFVAYATWAAFQNKFYSGATTLAVLFTAFVRRLPARLIQGPRPWWIPAFLPFSPALLILRFLRIRVTCYYYRGAYCKSFWADPRTAPLASPARVIGRAIPAAGDSEHPPLLPVRGPRFPDHPLPRRYKGFSFSTATPVARRWASASAPSSSSSTSFFSAATRSAVTRCDIWWEAIWINSHALRCAGRPTIASAASIAGTCDARGRVWSGSLFPTCSSDFARWESGTM